MIRLSAATRASDIFNAGSWGSAALHPRLYAVARYRGLAWISSPNDFLCKPVALDVRYWFENRKIASLTRSLITLTVMTRQGSAERCP